MNANALIWKKSHQFYPPVNLAKSSFLKTFTLLFFFLCDDGTTNIEVLLPNGMELLLLLRRFSAYIPIPVIHWSLVMFLNVIKVKPVFVSSASSNNPSSEVEWFIILSCLKSEAVLDTNY